MNDITDKFTEVKERIGLKDSLEDDNWDFGQGSQDAKWLKDRNDLFIDQEEQKASKQEEQKSVSSYEEPSSVYIILPWKEFKARIFEEPKWIVDKLIPEKGLCAIAGSPESCKSFLTTFIATYITKGETLWERFKTTKVPVLLIDQENIAVWIQKRISQFAIEEDIPLYIYPKQDVDFNLEDEQSLGHILGYIDRHNIGLVIIDTLRLAHSRDENSSTEMKHVIDQLKKITKKAAVLFIHHNRKVDKFNRGKVDGEDMMGSIFIRGCLDSQLTLVKVSDVSDSVTKIRVSQTKARYIRPIQTFEVTLEEIEKGLTFAYQGVVEDEKLKKDAAKGVILLLLKDRSFKRQELIDQLVKDGICGSRTAEAALAELVEEGKIDHTDSKPRVYFLMDTDKIPQSANTYIDYGIAESDETIKMTLEGGKL